MLGKALTGGYIGHAVTVANHKVFDAFYSDNDRHALMLSLIHIFFQIAYIKIGCLCEDMADKDSHQ